VCPWILLVGLIVAAPSAAEREQEDWTALGTTDAAKAHQVLTELAARPRQTVPWLRKRLQPVPQADPIQIARLLADLDSDRFRVRREAGKELEKLAERAEPALRKTLAGPPTPEAGLHVRIILSRLRNNRLHPPPDSLRIARAVEVLEQIGDQEARSLLTSLAAGAPEAMLTVEAQGALARLGQ
jgi:hypothetical protein